MSDDVGAEQKFYDERASKADQLEASGVNLYGSGFTPDSLAADLLAKFNGVEADKPGPFSRAGRVVSVRAFGKAAFVVLHDRTASLQVHVKKDALGEDTCKIWKLVDPADFIGVTLTLTLTLFESKRGELTLAASALRTATAAATSICSATRKSPIASSLRAFSELNDPQGQAQLDAKDRGQQETMDYDHDSRAPRARALELTAWPCC